MSPLFERIFCKSNQIWFIIKKPKQVFRKTSKGQSPFSFIGPALWNKFPEKLEEQLA